MAEAKKGEKAKQNARSGGPRKLAPGGNLGTVVVKEEEEKKKGKVNGNEKTDIITSLNITSD